MSSPLYKLSAMLSYICFNTVLEKCCVNTNNQNPLICTMETNKYQCVTLHQNFPFFFKSTDCTTQGTTYYF